jgi:predicted TPR repeat methyltransferase
MAHAMTFSSFASSSSSGDLRADRRFLHGQASAAAGDHAAAAELFAQCLELAPDWAAAWFALGEARERLGEREAALAAYGHAAAGDPHDVLGASLALARLGAAPVPESAAPAYVARLFDQYAPRFDAHLVEGLFYRAPALLHDAARSVCERTNRPMHFGRALDLGCGTGLAGAAFRACVDRLEGIDLSEGMIAEARAKGLYDALYVADAVGHLHATPARAFDLILAADVLVYIGDLAPLFREAARVLTDGGLFAFTTETHDGTGYTVSPDARFAHARGHVEASAAAAGLDICVLEKASTRRNKNIEAPGLICVAMA